MKGVFLMNLKKFLKAALCSAMVVAMAVTAGCGGGDKKAAEHENMNFMLNGFYCLNPNDFCIEYQTFPGFTSSLLV